MGTPEHRFSVRNWLALIGMAVTASAALVVMASLSVGASTSKIALIAGDAITAVEGNLVEDQVVARFTDADNIIPSINAVTRAPKVASCNDSQSYTATIDWGDGSAAVPGTVVCSDLNTWSVSGSWVYKDSGTYKITVTVTDTTDSDTASGQTDTATISDRALAAVSAANVTGTEGAKVTVTAIFNDSNTSYSNNEKVDPGLSATIDWGDGTTPSAADKIRWDDSGDSNVRVTASHVYDANKGDGVYTVKVTLKDDGEQSAMTTSKATIADAALTAGAAKSFVAPGAQASSPVVASFTDAAGAQAAVGDFTATINWGDGASSAGTFTQTAAGAFDVKGTHTYATAGTKSLTITVTDEEGQTLSMTATATVPALPTTGQPQTPVQPSLPLVALIVGLAIAGGTGLVLRRIRN